MICRACCLYCIDSLTSPVIVLMFGLRALSAGKTAQCDYGIVHLLELGEILKMGSFHCLWEIKELDSAKLFTHHGNKSTKLPNLWLGLGSTCIHTYGNSAWEIQDEEHTIWVSLVPLTCICCVTSQAHVKKELFIVGRVEYYNTCIYTQTFEYIRIWWNRFLFISQHWMEKCIQQVMLK